MAFPTALGLKILGGLSVAAAGATGAYFLLKPETTMSKWDESVLKTGRWAATNEDSKLKVTISETNSEINGSGTGQTWTWECEISKSSGSEAESTLVLNSSKLTDLKNKLGITDSASSGSETSEIKNRKRKFVENCARNRNDDQKQKASKETLTSPQNKIESTVVIGTSNDFEKLFEEKITSVSTNQNV